jgi:branched-chain amino acid transport system ATP-binding protein
MSEALLDVQALTVGYGHVEAIQDVSISVGRGETLALLGPNGAGKSTLLKAISGLTPVTSGRVFYEGRDITGNRPNRIARAGMSHVPEGRQVLGPLTVQENLELAALASRRCPKKELRAAVDEIFTMFPPLQQFRNVASGLLSGGQQQMLALGRALISRPVVLLLDEPSMGLAPVMVETIYAFLGDRGGALGDVAVVLAEQSRIALTVSDRACVISRGHVVFNGLASEVSHDLTVQAYLGMKPESSAN